MDLFVGISGDFSIDECNGTWGFGVVYYTRVRVKYSPMWGRAGAGGSHPWFLY